MCQYCYNRLEKGATAETLERNRNFAKSMGIDIAQATCKEYELAKQKLILSAKGTVVTDKTGKTVWDLNRYSFYENQEVSETIQPSLWLNGKSCFEAGVFEVVKGAIYQVRGLDLSNLTIIKGKTGWIVQDVMTTVETSELALKLLSQALQEDIRSHVSAVIISHSHWDHFGGIKGVVDEDRVGFAQEGKIPVYVPQGFDEECIKEYVFAGVAMDRRNDFQFARTVAPGEKGVVSGGLGIDHPKGTASYITPTNRISENGVQIIDGIEVEFQLTPGTEAPAEMNNYFKPYRALWIAENCCGTMHNLYPIRGAQLRDSKGWADYILEAFVLFGDKSDVVFQAHHWPHFNTEDEPDAVKDYLINSAAIYKYMHDQTLHLANKGFTAKEIARMIRIPDAMGKKWYNRPYYGSVEVNARAVYTKYLGFYNANPSELNPLSEVQEAEQFLKYAGSVEQIMERAETDYHNGDYESVVYAVSKVVYAKPDYEKARLLCADAYEQLAYAAESSIWRNAYLQGAYELRNGLNSQAQAGIKNRDLMQDMSPEYMLDYLGIAIDGERAADKELEFNLKLVDDNGKDISKIYIRLYGGALLRCEGYEREQAVSVTLTKRALFSISEKRVQEYRSEIKTDDFDSLLKLQSVVEILTDFRNFHIVDREPEKQKILR